MSRRRALLLIPLVALALLGALVLYLQTRHGFRHVLLPLVASTLKAQVQARDGFVSLSGTVNVEGLTFADEARAVLVDAERIFLDLSLPSLIGGRAPLILSLDVTKATVVLTRTAAPEDGAREEKPATGPPALMIPVAVERGRIDRFTLIVNDLDGATTIRDAVLDVNRLTAGQTGTIGLRTDLLLDRGARGTSWSGTVVLSLDVTQNAEGTRLRWSGTDTLLLREGRVPPDRSDPSTIVIEQALSGEFEGATQAVRLQSTVEAAQGSARIGSVTLEAGAKGAGEQRVLDATLGVKGIGPEALNAWLGEVAPVRFASAQVDGTATLTLAGGTLTLRSALAGMQMRLRIKGQGGATPPVDLSLDQAAVFNQKTKDLRVETLRLAVSDGVRTLLAGSLDRPVTVKLDRGQAGGAASHPESEPVAFTVRLSPVGVRALRPWLMMAGGDVLGGISSGEAEGAVAITIQEEGDRVDLTGSLDLTKLALEGSAGTGGIGPLALQTRAHATVAHLTTVTVDAFATRLSLNGKPVGQVNGAATFDVTTRPKILKAEIDLQLDHLPAETLNPLLARRGPARIQRAELAGQGTLRIADDRMAWQAALQGAQVSLRLPDTPGPTPPLDVLVEQAGTYDRAARTLRLEGLMIKVLKDRRPVITASLDRPLTLALDRAHSGSGSGDQADRKPIALTVDLVQLDIYHLRPWTALLGSQALASVAGGHVDGQFQVEIQGTGERLNVAGRLDAADLRLRRRGTGALTAPIGIECRAKATVVDLSRVTLDVLTARVAEGQHMLVQAKMAGAADTKSGAASLAAEASSANLAEALDRMALLDERQRAMLAGGEVKAEVKVETAGSNRPLTADAMLQARSLTIKLDARHAVPQSLQARAALEISADRTDLVLKQAGMTLESTAARPGTIAVTGHWPLGPPRQASDRDRRRAPARGGELAVTVKDWDAGPLEEVFRMMPGRASGPLPVAVQVVLGLDPATQIMTVRGHETVGPLLVRRQEGDPIPATLRVEQDLEKRGEEIHAAVITFTSERPQGHADHVVLKGTARLGERPSLQMNGRIDSLDAGWLADLFTGPHETGPAAAGRSEGSLESRVEGRPGRHPEHKAEDKAGRTGEKVGGKAGGKPGIKVGSQPGDTTTTGTPGLAIPPDLDLEAEIGTVTYRGWKIGAGRVAAKGKGGHLHVTLDPTGILGGTLQGTVDLTRPGGDQRVKWAARGQGLSLVALSQTLSPGREPIVQTAASFHTEGEGHGQGPAFLQSLTGSMVIDLGQGRFVRSELMAFLAAQTRLKDFEGLAFDSVHGELHIKDGWANLDRVHLDSNTITLDATGKVGLDGRLDVRVIPKVGPRLAKKAKDACAAPLLDTVDGFTTFPFVITVKGTAGNLAFGLEAGAGVATVTGLGRVLKNIGAAIEGCGGELIKSGQEAPEAVKGAVKGLFDTLLGTGEKKGGSR